MSSLAEAAPTPEMLERRSELPRRWPWLIWCFRHYAIRFVRKQFHAVRLSASGGSFPPNSTEPLLVVLNHPSWWDPMIGIVLSSLCRERDHFAAIDAAAVKQYAFFRRLGFVGVNPGSVMGAATFLRVGTSILAHPNRVFWVTAQGRFSDVRERPLALQPGVGHLAARLTRGIVLPVALEYTFWNERTSEALIRVGETLRVQDHIGLSGKDWLALIETHLTRNLDVLNVEAMTRDPAKFTVLLSGRAGVGGPYDWWRRIRSGMRGERFDPSHEAGMRENHS